MPHLAELGAIEVVGTSAGDAFVGRDEAIIFGRQGADVFTANTTLASDQWFYGGSGNDTYVVRPGTSVVVGDGFGSSGDVVRARGIGFDFEFTGFAEIDGRHLLVLDFSTFTDFMILDWLNPERRIERLELEDGSRALTADAIRSHPHYAGNFSLEEALEDAPPGVVDLFRTFVREGFDRAAELETTPQPNLVQITGTFGPDLLEGDARPEIIRGLAADDEISGRGGADQIFGNAGADVLHGNGGADLLVGGRDRDVLHGDNSDDELRGEGAIDDLHGGLGDDLVRGGADDDFLHGDAGADVLRGGAGADTLWGDEDPDVLFGGDGRDWLDGGFGRDELNGGLGRDQLLGREGGDVLNGGAGNEELEGGPGHDVMNGGEDADTMLGEVGNDIMRGGPGADFLDGGTGDDWLEGGIGDDTLVGDDGDDTVDGQDGNDHVEGGLGTDFLTGGPGGDRFVIRFEAHTDRITDFSEDDILELRSVVSGVSGIPDGEVLDDFLQFAFDGVNTALSINQDGGGDFAAPDLGVLFLSADLVGGAGSQAEIIDGLLADGQLVLA